jgi:DNA-3-methyladenine glycosylase
MASRRLIADGPSGRYNSGMTDFANARNLVPQSFYARPAEIVAKELIGKYLVRRIGVGGADEHALLITETEAYVGAHDLACHGRFGLTNRTRVMFGPAGHWYVYFIYGMYWMLNIVTGDEGSPQAVLFRTAGDYTGPGKLCRELAIDKRLYGAAAVPASGLWIEDRGYRVKRGALKRTPRIGVDYAGEWKDKPLRFVLSS